MLYLTLLVCQGDGIGVKIGSANPTRLIGYMTRHFLTPQIQSEKCDHLS